MLTFSVLPTDAIWRKFSIASGSKLFLAFMKTIIVQSAVAKATLEKQHRPINNVNADENRIFIFFSSSCLFSKVKCGSKSLPRTLTPHNRAHFVYHAIVNAPGLFQRIRH